MKCLAKKENIHSTANTWLHGKQNRSLLIPLGQHRREAHGEDDFSIKFYYATVLPRESEIEARKTLGFLDSRTKHNDEQQKRVHFDQQRLFAVYSVVSDLRPSTFKRLKAP